MYVLQVTGTNPALYKGIDGAGFIDTVDTVTQALQFERIGDAQSFGRLIHESTTPVQDPA